MKKIIIAVLVSSITSFSCFAMTQTEIEAVANRYKFTNVEAKLVLNEKANKKDLVLDGGAPSFKSVADFLSEVKSGGHEGILYNNGTDKKKGKVPFIITIPGTFQ